VIWYAQGVVLVSGRAIAGCRRIATPNSHQHVHPNCTVMRTCVLLFGPGVMADLRLQNGHNVAIKSRCFIPCFVDDPTITSPVARFSGLAELAATRDFETLRRR
jgi:hypothetical protein